MERSNVVQRVNVIEEAASIGECRTMLGNITGCFLIAPFEFKRAYLLEFSSIGRMVTRVKR